MSDILFERKDGGAHVTFNRPKLRNALNAEMILELAIFVDEISRDPEIRYLTFRGEGEHFAAGGDVAAYSKTLDQDASTRRFFFERRVRGNADTFVRLEALPIPVISLVRGAVAGAGLSFLLVSDFVLAEEGSFMIFAQPKIGLPLDLATTYFLPRIIGVKAARKLALTGARIDAEEAKTLGIVDEIHPAGQLDSALAALVNKFSQAAPRAAGRSKQLLNISERNTIVQQMELEVRAIGDCVTEPDFAEGVTAFMEKRKAVFRG